MKFFLLAALIATAVAAPEPPTSEFDPNDLMSGKNPDPVLLTRVTGIYSRAGPNAAEEALARQGGGSQQSHSGNRGFASEAAAATGNADFVIDEIQYAPLIDEFDFNNDNAGQQGGRSGGYNAGQQGGRGQSGGYNGPPPAARSYGPPASGGGYPSRY